MKDKWPLFRLCGSGWKLDESISDIYPGYKWSYLDDKGNLRVKVKTEEMDLDNIRNSDHPGNKNSKDLKKIETEKSKSDASNQKCKAISTSICIPSADVHFHLVSSGAGKIIVPQLPDIEARSSRPGIEVSD